MNKTSEIILAGFGGQGILFAGKVLAYAGLLAGKQITWLPSYGPEMRGGTANCNVILSDDAVSSPVIVKPNMLIVMNKPSLDKFEDTVKEGGVVVVDSTLINRQVKRSDVNTVYIPASQIAHDMNKPKLANMIMIGKLIKETGALTLDELKAGIKKSVPASKEALLETNYKAVEAGYNY